MSQLPTDHPHPLNCPRPAYSPKPFTALAESLESCPQIIHFAVPSFSCLAAPPPRWKAPAGHFQTTLKREKYQVWQARLRLLLLLQESGPCVRVSAYSAASVARFPSIKRPLSDSEKKRTKKEELDFNGRKLIKWFSRGVGTLLLFSVCHPLHGLPYCMNSRTLCEPFKLSLLGCLSIKEGFEYLL